ncbi:SCP2 sterol-binding domain-containing protein [Pistricoccus aurantiacus]|uniref:SCP2 sterol-binding domain-containing protein n=1 Tax=Pistricoccus aurantiacus TaxID=1883414 RepID=A0A5B8SSE6_9GAMM|nr:SCP2 sterol-binding domain-containing protein [Pistricoccus aurantiacus]QEA40032.1 SCP2 sterol-binding domain-containing protein [Pistricoccus aurantiacus]
MTSPQIEKLHRRFDPQAAQGMHEVFQFHFSDIPDHFLVIQDGTLEIGEGEHDEPSVSLSMSLDTLRDIMNGEISGMNAFMSGRLKATGNLMLAPKLGQLFPSKR